MKTVCEAWGWAGGSSGPGGCRQLAGRSPFPRLRLASRWGRREDGGCGLSPQSPDARWGGSSGWWWRRVLQAGVSAGRLRRPPLSSRFAGTASAGASTCTDPGTAPPGATATGYVGPGHSPPAARQQPSGLERCAGHACRHPAPPPAPRQTEGQGWRPGGIRSCRALLRRGLSGISRVSEPVDAWAEHQVGSTRLLGLTLGRPGPQGCAFLHPLLGRGAHRHAALRPRRARFAQEAPQRLGGPQLSAPGREPGGGSPRQPACPLSGAPGSTAQGVPRP